MEHVQNQIVFIVNFFVGDCKLGNCRNSCFSRIPPPPQPITPRQTKTMCFSSACNGDPCCSSALAADTSPFILLALICMLHLRLHLLFLLLSTYLQSHGCQGEQSRAAKANCCCWYLQRLVLLQLVQQTENLQETNQIKSHATLKGLGLKSGSIIQRRRSFKYFSESVHFSSLKRPLWFFRGSRRLISSVGRMRALLAAAKAVVRFAIVWKPAGNFAPSHYTKSRGSSSSVFPRLYRGLESTFSSSSMISDVMAADIAIS